jgi:hypothetical protein
LSVSPHVLDLLTPEAVRERSTRLWIAGERDELSFWRINLDALQPVGRIVVDEIQRNYPNGNVPFHSRWRHFEFNGDDLSAECLARTTNVHERARAAFDLAIVSVLLDAGAGSTWTYTDAATGISAVRSEGLALASLRLFEAGYFTNDTNRAKVDTSEVDASVLANMNATSLGLGMQSRAHAPLLGLDSRAALLRQLGTTLLANPAVFARHGKTRPGHLYDYLKTRAVNDVLPAREILIAVLTLLGDIWPGATAIDGINVGDVAAHPLAGGEGSTSGLVPFHKLSQWLSYSLIEPLQTAGLTVNNLDALTGLAEYRNGGLLADGGLLTLRDPSIADSPQAPREQLVVEWRALTVVGLDRVAQVVRQQLDADSNTLPLASILQGGTWSAGRQLAAARRHDGGPPINIISDGTLF